MPIARIVNSKQNATLELPPNRLAYILKDVVLDLQGEGVFIKLGPPGRYDLNPFLKF